MQHQAGTLTWIIMLVDILRWEEGSLAIHKWWRQILQVPIVDIQALDNSHSSSTGAGNKTIELRQQVVVTLVCIRPLPKLMAKVLVRNSKTTTSSHNSNKLTIKCHQPRLVILLVWKEWLCHCMRLLSSWKLPILTPQIKLRLVLYFWVEKTLIDSLLPTFLCQNNLAKQTTAWWMMRCKFLRHRSSTTWSHWDGSTLIHNLMYFCPRSICTIKWDINRNSKRPLL